MDPDWNLSNEDRKRKQNEHLSREAERSLQGVVQRPAMSPQRAPNFVKGALEKAEEWRKSFDVPPPQQPPLDVLEKSVKKQIKEYLKSIGAYQFWPVQMGYGARTVDCLVCFQGRFLAIEVKRSEGGRLTAKQCRTLHEIHSARGNVVVATTVDAVRDLIGEING